MALITLESQENTLPTPPIHPVEINFINGTVEQLIRSAVEAQIRDLAIHRHLSAFAIRRALDTHYKAKVNDSFIQQFLEWQKINMRQEVKSALQGFQEGVFSIYIDGQELLAALEEYIDLSPYSRVTFHRQKSLSLAS